MGWFTGVVLYVLIWWVALFAVLPLWVTPAREPDPINGWTGAPEKAFWWRKVFVTTLVSAAIWGAADVVISHDWISFRHGFFSLRDETDAPSRTP